MSRNLVFRVIKEISNEPFASSNENDIIVRNSKTDEFFRVQARSLFKDNDRLIDRYKTFALSGVIKDNDIFYEQARIHVKDYKIFSDIIKYDQFIERAFFMHYLFLDFIEFISFDGEARSSLFEIINSWKDKDVVNIYVVLFSMYTDDVVARTVDIFDQRLRDLSSVSMKVEQYESDFKDALDAQLKSGNGSIQELKDQVSREIASIKEAAIEVVNLNSAEKIWDKKARNHKVSGNIYFYLSIFILLATVAISIIEWPSIKNELVDVFKVATGYQAVPIFLVPVISLLWIVRIISRKSSSELLLRDDAEQRRALVLTYYIMVADEKAKMQQNDRILILNSLFRALPGHQNEEIAPPSFADIVKEMMGSKPS